MFSLSKYATISVPTEIKKRLEEKKGQKEWGEFLLDIITESEQLRGKSAFEELRKLVTEEDIAVMRTSSKEFRENFKLK